MLTEVLHSADHPDRKLQSEISFAVEGLKSRGSMNPDGVVNKPLASRLPLNQTGTLHSLKLAMMLAK
ncbi:hypothetical protein MLD38_020140 [Melastoma candidum]|uniref:Uncharacterized protein n=1 Tax=Melastoma candidum TaxID=119954 RepID=A0ACB9QBI6_9MYRT|nr:hypothetical protein MLD38_020140 [Melastoma candidum]